MKIYTITCNNAYNYGAVLQAYGLQRYLEKKGEEVEIIDFIPPHLRKISKQYRGNILAVVIRKILYFPDYHKSARVFNSFRKKYLKETTVCKTVQDIVNLPPSDLYICGSDQVWNPEMENGYCSEYFLHLGNDIKKASYAASIGLKEVDSSYLAYLNKMLKDFMKVTVRERDSVETLRKANISSEYVVDPVYLIEKEEWAKVEGEKYREKYILVYALHHIQGIYDYAKELGKKHDCLVYVVSVEIKERRRGSDRFFWNPSVEDFVSLVDGAQAVVTNSFHGVSFSCIFEKPVHIFDTEQNDIRIKNLVDIFDMHNRVVAVGDEIIDNTVSEHSIELMKNEIKRSKEILDSILEEVSR